MKRNASGYLVWDVWECLNQLLGVPTWDLNLSELKVCSLKLANVDQTFTTCHVVNELERVVLWLCTSSLQDITSIKELN